MKPITLELRTEGRVEIVNLYNDFYTHYTEEDGRTNLTSQTYLRINTTKEKCLSSYLNQGFGEKDYDRKN